MQTSATLSSIQVGQPTDYGFDAAVDPHDRPWTTAFFKTPVEGSVFAGWTNLEGDAQADLGNHGGIDKAVLAYSADHYPAWRGELGLPDLPYGGFGENLTIAGLTESSVYIGDILGIGDARFEVSQPRQPCWKLARRWRMHALTALVVETGRSGWYLRVLEQGRIERGAEVTVIDRPNPEWSVARANQILYRHKTDAALTRALAEVSGLSTAWSEDLRDRAEQLEQAARDPRREGRRGSSG